MSHAFILHPDPDLLAKYGYQYICPLEIDDIQEEEQRLALEAALRQLCSEYDLTEHYDTLFYIVLLEHNHADMLFQHYHHVYNSNKRIKELAQLLLLLNPEQKHKPVSLKVESAVDALKVTDDKLLKWIGELINKAMREGDFVPGQLGEETLAFVGSDPNSLLSDETLNYDRISYYANRKIRKPTIRERNKVLAPFLFNLLHFLNNETALCAPPTIRFTDKQLNFLYSLAVVLEWIDDKRVDSEGKDYLSTLLLNHLNK